MRRVCILKLEILVKQVACLQSNEAPSFWKPVANKGINDPKLIVSGGYSTTSVAKFAFLVNVSCLNLTAESQGIKKADSEREPVGFDFM